MVLMSSGRFEMYRRRVLAGFGSGWIGGLGIAELGYTLNIGLIVRFVDFGAKSIPSTGSHISSLLREISYENS